MVPAKKLVGGLSAILLAAALVIAGALFPARSWAVTSGPGVWDLMVFGNYDLVSPNTGSAFPNTSTPTWNNLMDNGYGAGLGVAYWFNDTIAFRLEVQGNFFQGAGANTSALESAPLTGGFEAKLYGSADYYLYAVVDAGAAYELSLPNTNGPALSAKGQSNAWSGYGDVGLGMNFDYVFVEAKFAYLMDALPHTASQNGLWYIPITAGFNF
jgi:hypothetical protein